MRLVVFVALAGFSLAGTGSAQMSGGSGGKTVASEAYVPPEDTGTTPIVLTLADAFKKVQSANFTVLLSRESVLQAIEAARRSRADILPSLEADASQSRTRSVSFDSGSDSYSSLGNSFSARLSASYTLLDPTLIATYEAAKKGVAVSRYQYDSAMQDVLNTVAQVYFTHLRNTKRFLVIKANIKRAKELLKLAQSQLDAGVATQIDVTRAQTEVATQEQARLQQETVVYQSELQLKNLLSLNQNAPLNLKDYKVSETLDSAAVSFDQAAVFQNRSDYRSAEAQLQQNKLEKRAAALQRLPSLQLYGDYGIANREAFDGNNKEAWSAGLSISVPIFEGFRIGSNKRLAESRIRSQQYRVDDLGRQISSQVRLAIQDAKSRLAQIAVARQNRNLASEELRLARIRFEQGVADNREIIDAQNKLATADDNLVEAVYQYNLSRVELARARGDVRNVLND